MIDPVTYAHGVSATASSPKAQYRLPQTNPIGRMRSFDAASILFADVVDFTPLASGLDAREVVGMLDRLFTTFDELVDRYEVEKIKTIGDCYMVAAGGPGLGPTTRTRLPASRSS